MQPPLPTGTLLANRYRINRVLGQGGFGRTYLVEDQGRFNEPCALKEFIPTQQSGYVLEKARELFGREASTLYQLQHPQVPQFRATFEEGHRFFLVQDYIEGKTYRALLNERKPQGQTFSEAEVVRLLVQVLPVLSYIHSKGMIHRDIAPDNLILRSSDSKPVLIDFGVVKEAATRFQGDLAPQSTVVGKLGFAPSEQLQTGRAYPSSDLYALAATAVVLFTGREPQELFDDTTLSWQWQRYVTTPVNPGFAQILNRMLSNRPGDRYQSADEVLQALQSLQSGQPDPNLSRVATMAVGRRPTPTQQASAPVQTRPIAPVVSPVPDPTHSIWDRPWVPALVIVGLILVSGIGSWAVVSALLRGSERNEPAPTPLFTLTPTPTPTPSAVETPTETPTAAPSPTRNEIRLQINPGTSVRQSGGLSASQIQAYVISAQQGERLSVRLRDSRGVLMSVLDSNGNPLDASASGVSSWSGELPYSDDYSIELRAAEGVSQGNFDLTVELAPVDAPSPSPSQPEPPPGPQILPERVQFGPGQTSATVAGQVGPSTIRRYLVNVQEGQTLSVELLDGNAQLGIRYPDGRPVEDAQGIVQWQAQIPASGEYQIDVVAQQNTNFSLDISAR